MHDGPDLPDDAWAHALGHLLWDVAARTRQIGERMLDGADVTVAMAGMLDGIGSRPGITIAEMTHWLPVSQQSISQLVARIERLGWIERRVAHGRSAALHLTAAGEKARLEGVAAEARAEARFEEILGAERYEQLRALLEEARTALATAEAPGGSSR